MAKHLFLLIFLLFFPISIFADSSNNIYGIHLAQPQLEDIRSAADLVNSNGGKWGYVTLVIQENDRDKNKWQGIFDLLRELHLIPIIRLATQPVGENWRRPEVEDAQSWADFLNSLNWVVKNRYLVLFNEPNHGSEWGGEVDEKSYAQVAFSFAKTLKEKNPDFFLMLAGFDASTPSWRPGMEDEEVFLSKVLSENPKIFEYIDGWSSHSYPNPGFSGSPWDFGRGTVRTYQWELEMLRRFGMKKNLPVFITETGWKHKAKSLLDENIVSEYFKIAFEKIWGEDNRVRAVTPFIFNYQGPPFLEFSWKKYQSNDFYQHYYTIQSLTKIKGNPEQIEKGEINFNLPKELVAKSNYNFKINLKNQGQGIWDKNENYELRIINEELKTSILIGDLKDIRPFEEKTIDFSLKTAEEKEKQKVKFVLTKNNKTILESKPWQYKILPLPDLNIQVNFWPFRRGKGKDFEVQLFDIDDRLIFKKKGVKIENSQGVIKNIQNIAIGELYRAVILKPGYLPRQRYIVFQKKSNFVRFKSILPFDFDNDGKLSWKDLINKLKIKY